ncbi:GSCOCG00004315001-RA-CDS [Cotesia congregata]|uniref:Similar to APOD: Apolipoprotein D (Macaca fascicularis) n=1 Tax=Cotesia congregata TaxID=51543 RepID=A0A8J2HQM4_COTCN|nr:GSCOCG00004315001-RA-CDS [Cotesia congregata]CAG5109097.1 Similar to APOD: Apolipoprotein D (Macaca fascicularis) [Cotesia congregata]
MSALFNCCVLFFCLVVGSFAQISQLGSCPAVQPVQNFQPQNLSGMWYQVRRYDNFYDINERCNRVNLTIESGNRLRISERSVNTLSGEPITTNLTLTPVNRAQAQYRVRLSVFSRQTSLVTLLDTDYSSFAIFYMCQDFANTRLVYLWLISRQRTLGLNTLGRRLRVEAANNLPIGELRTVGQLNCPA